MRALLGHNFEARGLARLGHGLAGAGGVNEILPGLTATIPAQTQLSADVTGIPVMVDLSQATLPASTSQDGGNLRAFDSANNPVPMFVTGVDQSLGTGLAYLKANVSNSADTTYTIRTVDGATFPRRNDAVGVDAVFSAYHAAFLPGITLHAPGSGGAFWDGEGNGDPNTYAFSEDGPQIFSHQGIASDRANGALVAIDNTTLRKLAGYDPVSMPVIDINNDAHLAVRAVTGLANVDHICDGDIDNNGHLWSVCNNIAFDEVALCQWDTRSTNMPLLNAWDISATHLSALGDASSGCCVVVDDEVWAVSYNDADGFHRYDKQGNSLGKLAFTNASGAPVTLSNVEGGTYSDGQIYLVLEGLDEVASCTPDGVFPTSQTDRSDGDFNRRTSRPNGDKIEGITRYGSGWLQIITPTTGSGYLARQIAYTDNGALGDYVSGGPMIFASDTDTHRFVLSDFNSSVMSFGGNIATRRDGTTNRCLIHMETADGLYVARALMDDGRYPGLNNTVDDWLYTTPKDIVPDDTYIHFAGRFGATTRAVFADGAKKTEEAYTAPPTPLTNLILFSNAVNAASATVRYEGFTGFLWTSTDEKSDDWIAVDALACRGGLLTLS